MDEQSHVEKGKVLKFPKNTAVGDLPPLVDVSNTEQEVADELTELCLGEIQMQLTKLFQEKNVKGFLGIIQKKDSEDYALFQFGFNDLEAIGAAEMLKDTTKIYLGGSFNYDDPT